VLPQIRVGVRLPELKARIFNLVRWGGGDSIGSDDLFTIPYNDNVPTGKGIRHECNRKTLKAHVQQIKELLEDGGYHIICRGRSPYSTYRLESCGRDGSYDPLDDINKSVAEGFLAWCRPASRSESPTKRHWPTLWPVHGAGFLIVRADRSEPLVVLPLRLAMEIARVAGNSRLMTAPTGAQPSLISQTSSNQETSYV
jgi:hypothetical protein